MIARVLFRTDPLTGNRILRTGLVVGALFIAGASIWLASALTTATAGQSVKGLNLDHSDIEAVAQRQMPVNREIAALVGRTPQPVPSFGDAMSVGAPALEQRPENNARADAPPRLFHTGSQQTAKENTDPDDARKGAYSYTETKGIQVAPLSFATGGGALASVPLAQYTGFPSNSVGSAVVFKRLENPAIQKRDNSSDLSEPGLPAGTAISCQLLTGIVSGSALPVMLRVRENVVHRGAVVIPAGSTLLGISEASYESRRLFVRINRIIIGDAEIGICASVLDAGGRAGLCDRYIDTARQQLLPAFFAGVLAEFGRVFSDRDAICGVSGPGLGNTAVQVGSAFLSGTSSGLDAVAQTLAAKAKEAKAVIIAYPNQVVQAILEDKIPLELLLRAIRGR